MMSLICEKDLVFFSNFRSFTLQRNRPKAKEKLMKKMNLFIDIGKSL